MGEIVRVVPKSRKRANSKAYDRSRVVGIGVLSVSGHLAGIVELGLRSAMDPLAAILIVDDDADVRQAATLALGRHVARIDTAPSPEGLAIAPGVYDCVLLDMNFLPSERSGRAGMDALAAIRKADPALSVVLMTGYGAVSLAVEALKHGAEDFLLKPWRNDALLAAVRAAAARTADERAGAPLDAVERAAIEKALARNDGNIAQAAAALGLSRPALYRRMSKHGL